jgi:uncharacterized protein YegP (UPF0339 family)
MNKAKIEYWQTGNSWYWHLVASNGRILADGGGHNTERDMLDSLASVATAFGGSLMDGIRVEEIEKG